MEPEIIRQRLRLAVAEVAQHAGVTIADVMRYERAPDDVPVSVRATLAAVYRSMAGAESVADRHHRIRCTRYR